MSPRVRETLAIAVGTLTAAVLCGLLSAAWDRAFGGSGSLSGFVLSGVGCGLTFMFGHLLLLHRWKATRPPAPPVA
jgi:hypothetical protein